MRETVLSIQRKTAETGSPTLLHEQAQGRSPPLWPCPAGRKVCGWPMGLGIFICLCVVTVVFLLVRNPPIPSH